ncbi:uncharacterized protein LOC117100088 isoform X2 [Anneissia japonica]|uniref:uncharacterized protein LOC117100088 isoform X2 n=1 Tax=Anneissia japonica TaxID=1529436 RepID=UPI0014259861|nr:uncharacterized protein LOC117100088 isoform X2 [Anneissia japonica]
MNEKEISYLRGFHSSYERSFNLRVIADDKEIESAYKQAKLRGRLPFNRSKILILGDHAVGKTSTCRRLQGKDFRHDEPSTVGIETKLVKAKVSDVNSKWFEVSTTPLEDYESSASWWAVSHVRKRDTKKATQVCSTPEVNSSVSLEKPIEDIIYQITLMIPIIITFLIGGFTFGFGLVVWMYILCLMYIFDTHTAYRFGSAITIGLVLVDSTLSIDKVYTEIQYIDLDTWIKLSAAIILFMYGLAGLITGVLLGTGGRTGVCIGFCIMVHPKQKTFTLDNVAEMILGNYRKAYYNFIICFVSVINILIFRFLQAKILYVIRKNSIPAKLSVIIFIIVAVCVGRPHSFGIFTIICIAVINIFILIGAILGRKSVAFGYIPQNYIIKKSTGFIAGIFIAVACGWELVEFKTLNINSTQSYFILRYLFCLLHFLIPIIAFILYEWFAYMKVKNTTSIPINHVRQSMKACIRNESYLDARLSLWDFAGQDMYYNTHHIFMPKQGVYLVVFNAVEAVMNPKKQIKRLHFWLQSVAVHADIKNVAVFLVGTRRESVGDTNALLDFIKLVKANLYKQFKLVISYTKVVMRCFDNTSFVTLNC